jgi:hypothetical protein
MHKILCEKNGFAGCTLISGNLIILDQPNEMPGKPLLYNEINLTSELDACSVSIKT